MKISELEYALNQVDSLTFYQPDGTKIPAHFHISEAGLSSKHFIDCGGKIGSEHRLNLQIWVANDYHHRLKPKTLLKIIEKARPLTDGKDLDVEMEYQTQSITRFGVEFRDNEFHLTTLETACRAEDSSICLTPGNLKGKASCC